MPGDKDQPILVRSLGHLGTSLLLVWALVEMYVRETKRQYPGEPGGIDKIRKSSVSTSRFDCEYSRDSETRYKFPKILPPWILWGLEHAWCYWTRLR